MKQDLRELFKEERERQKPTLKKGHQARFAALLDKELPQDRTSNKYFFLKLAASFLVLLGIGWLLYPTGSVDPTQQVVESTSQEQEKTVPDKVFDLREVAPEFEKIENFYLTSLNLELANLEVNDRNRGMIDSFMQQLAGLDKEYQRLNEELYEYGATTQTLEAMIANLQFRIELLKQVKNRMENDKLKKKEPYENVRI